MEKVADLAYIDDYHRTAEAEKKSCAACHVDGGGAFASLNECRRCHQDLELPKSARGFFPPLGILLFFPFPAPVDDDSAGYIGAKRCAVCHEEQSDNFADNPHTGLRDTQRFDAKETYCECCHGPGLKHVVALDPVELTDFRVAQPATVNQTRLGCHAQSEGFENHAVGAHERNGVACVDCHGVHASTGPRLLTSESTELCSSCHPDLRASFNRPFGHKLSDGALKCIDCHNPHGDAPRDLSAPST